MRLSCIRVLFEHATSLGAEIRRGVALAAFASAEDSVRVELGDQTVECGWLVGCDGGRSLVRKLAGFDFPGRFTDNARQATSYRRGRVLLAGDAAHVHSPFGGQGLNLGVGDAMNLGWKLAAEIQGWAPAGLLDSYTRERHPIGAWVLDWTRAQIAIMKPEPDSRALRGVLGDLARTEDGATYLAGSIGGLRQRYDLGSEDPRVGRSAPEIVLADGSRLADHLHRGAGVLIGQGESSDERLTVVAGDGPSMLVRPDGIVAWVAGDGDLDEALRRWFGQVAVEAVPAEV